jgi:hypothetical protein
MNATHIRAYLVTATAARSRARLRVLQGMRDRLEELQRLGIEAVND